MTSTYSAIEIIHDDDGIRNETILLVPAGEPATGGGVSQEEISEILKQLGAIDPMILGIVELADDVPVDHVCHCGHRSSEHAGHRPNLSNPCRRPGCRCSGFDFASTGIAPPRGVELIDDGERKSSVADLGIESDAPEYLVRLYRGDNGKLIESRLVAGTLDAVVDYVGPFVPGLDVGGVEETLLAADEIPNTPFALDQGEIIVRIVRDPAAADAQLRSEARRPAVEISRHAAEIALIACEQRLQTYRDAGVAGTAEPQLAGVVSELRTAVAR